MKKFITILLVCLTLNLSAQFTANVPTEKDSIVDIRKPITMKNNTVKIDSGGWRGGAVIPALLIVVVIAIATISRASGE